MIEREWKRWVEKCVRERKTEKKVRERERCKQWLSNIRMRKKNYTRKMTEKGW